tara:strand:+ start:14255 stop:15805 length:1551 start_codon:yes stop_codon:yes gene_type:complete
VNLAEIREAIRVKTGYPERGKAGTDRLNNTINQSLRTLWGEIPEVLLKCEHRLQLEPPRSLTVARDSNDPKVLVAPRITSVADAPFSPAEVENKVLSARYVEWNHNGRWYQRRIAEVYLLGQEPEIMPVIVVTEPIPIEAASRTTFMNCNIYTYEYPYDADIQSIKRIVKNPESNPREIPISAVGGELSGVKISNGWQSTGQIQYYARGDFYQQPAPHYKPELSATVRHGPFEKWGYEIGSGGLPANEKVAYGQAGTFSYKVCHVWGRFPEDMRQIDGGADNPDVGYPYYISSPSQESDKASTTWGGPAIEISLPDIDYIYGYGQDNTIKSYQKSGIEKWIFRARHETNTDVAPGAVGSRNSKIMEDDGIYYLWKVVDAETTSLYDAGQMDPVSRRYPLKEFMGHYHIRFDKRPSSKDQILISCTRRPPLLKNDSDSPNLPPECYGCIIELACSYLLGDRDGDLKRKGLYYDAHLMELQKLKRMYSFSGHERPAFGNGISSMSYFRTGDYPVTEKT